MSLRISKYTIRDITTNTSRDYTFDNPISFSQTDREIFLSDLLNPGDYQKASNSETTLEYKLDLKNIKQIKNYQNKSTHYFENDVPLDKNIEKIFADELQIEHSDAFWSKRILDAAKFPDRASLDKAINQLDSEIKLLGQNSGEREGVLERLSQLKESVKTGKSPEEINKLDRLLEINAKVKKLEKEIEIYQSSKKNREENEKKAKTLDIESKMIDQKIESVKMLIEVRERLKGEMAQFSEIASDSGLNNKVNQIKAGRNTKLIMALKSVPMKFRRIMQTDPTENSALFHIDPRIALLAAAQVILTTVLYLITLNPILIILGLVCIIILFFFLMGINISQGVNIKSPSANIKPALSAKIDFAQIYPEDSKEENQFLLNAAWFNALKSEFDTIESSINARLGEKTYEQLMEEKTRLDSERGSQSNQNQQQVITPEEYYQRRRQLDMLQIEKGELNVTIDSAVETELIELQTKLDKMDSDLETGFSVGGDFPVILINYTNIEGIEEIQKERQVVLVNN